MSPSRHANRTLHSRAVVPVQPLPPRSIGWPVSRAKKLRLTVRSHDVAFSSESPIMVDAKGKLTPAEFLAALKGRKPPSKPVALRAAESVDDLDFSDLD